MKYPQTPTLKSQLKRITLTAALMLGTMTFAVTASQTLNAEVPDIRTLAYGHILARSLHAVAYFKVADALQEGPKSTETLAQELNLKEDPLKRILRVLANHNILEMTKKGIFSLPSHSRSLISTEKGSLQPAFAKEFDQRRWSSIGHLEIPLKTGKSSFNELYGEGFYEYLEHDSEAAELFNKGMKNFSDREDEEVGPLLPLGSSRIHCDVGGGAGGLVSQILMAHPHLEKGILTDLKDAVQRAKEQYGGRFEGRFEGTPGNFFVKLPSADTYSIKRVFHNWSDEECVAIFQTCLKAMNDKSLGRIFIIEKVIPEILDGSLLIDADLLGLTLGGGAERTLAEFIKIGQEAGFTFEDEIKTKSGVSILSFKPSI